MSFLLLALVYFYTLDKATLVSLWQRPVRQTGLFACTIVLAVLWRIKAGILPDLNLHILGLTAVTLILGWRLASLAALLASALLCAFGQIEIMQLPVFVITTGLLPIYFSYGVFVLIYNTLPRHLFIYIFLCSFLCAAFAACVKIISGAVYFWFIDQYTAQQLLDNYVYLCALIWFPEAMLNGMAMTLLIIYRPHWVRSFYDKEYLAQ